MERSAKQFDFSRFTEVTVTTVPAGTSTGAAGPAGPNLGGYAAVAILVPHSNSVPSVQMQCRMMAILRATAIFAFLAPIRFISRVPHSFRADHRWVRCSSTVAASEVGPAQPVAPFRDAAVEVQFAGCLRRG